MKTLILGGASVTRSVNAADNRCINLFLEGVPEGGKEGGFFSRCPGLRTVAEVGNGPIRGMWAFGGIIYVASGFALYSVDKSFIATFLGTISGTGPVSMVDNGTQLFIACNPDGYIYNASTTTFAQITDPDFPGAVTVGYLDGYFVFNEPDSQRFWVTSLLDGTSIDPLDFASAEGLPDGVVSLIVDHREVWLFGTNSIEAWYNSPTGPDFPLTRISGAFLETGCAAPYSLAKLDNSVFWLGSDARGNGIVYRADGYTGKRVSTHAVEFAIQNYSTISDAIAYSYQMEGHAFYVLAFPTVGKTWVYDVSMAEWHERAGFINGEWTRHRGNCAVNFNNEILVGDFENGNIYAFDLDTYADGDHVQKYLRSWRALATGQNNLKRSAHHSLQLDAEAGVGLNTGQGSDPQVCLRWSDDGGHTWSNEHWRSFGAIGATGQRVIWRRLGMTEKLRDRVYEISGTDPTKIAIMGAELYVTPTNA